MCSKSLIQNKCIEFKNQSKAKKIQTHACLIVRDRKLLALCSLKSVTRTTSDPSLFPSLSRFISLSLSPFLPPSPFLYLSTSFSISLPPSHSLSLFSSLSFSLSTCFFFSPLLSSPLCFHDFLWHSPVSVRINFNGVWV